jgi:uncharacterized protein YkwD
MRTSTLLSAALAGCALGSPLMKRDLVVETDTVYDVVYTTEYVTETAGASVPAVTSTAAAESTSSSSTAVVAQNSLFRNRHSWSWASSVTSNVEVASSTEAASSVAAPSTTSTPVVESTSSVYIAPSTSVYVAPSSTAAATTSSAAETSSAATASATTYQQRVLVHHNVHRANHSAPDLVWDDALAATAQKIGQSCSYAHNVAMDGGGYGQNIAAGVQANNISAVITDLFYNGEVNYFNGLYGQANPDMSNFENWGHFSQIVWKGTTKVGCATVDCSASGLANVGQYVSPYFTVCNYGPPGNYGGQYASNIGASLNRATVGWNYGL